MADGPIRLRGAIGPAGTRRSAEDIGAWLDALAVQARRLAPAVVDRCLERWPRARSVLDIAGGHGEYGLEFARRGLSVTLQDLPEVIDIVGTWPPIEREGLELCPGDVFEHLAPGPFDLVFCAGFTHTLPDRDVADLVARLRGITARSGGIAIHTFLLSSGGDTHGEDEYRGWLQHAGYGDVDVVDLHGRSLLRAATG